MKLSVIIPCFNESKNLPKLLIKLKCLNKDDFEIIIVDNGSTDNTYDLLNDIITNNQYSNIKVLRLKKNKGYGFGIISGINISKGNIIAWTHADLQTDPKDVLDSFQYFIKQPNYTESILTGKRLGRNYFDSFFTFFMSVIVWFILKVKIWDINAQPKMFHRSFLNKLSNPPNDFSFDLFLLYKAKINNMIIFDFPVNFGKREHGKSKGGGTFFGKYKLIKRTLFYILKLKQKLKT